MKPRVFCGPNSYALKQAVKELKEKFIKEYGELAVEVIDGEEAGYEQVVQAIESVPFLADKKLVIVYGLSLIKEAIEAIEEIVKKSATGNSLLIVERKVDKRSAYFKHLKKRADLTEFNDLDERTLASWLADRAKAAGASLTLSDASFLVQRVGTNQESASNELAKLIDYDKQVTRASIELLVEASPQTTIFNLLDAAFSGDARKALNIYEEQRTGGEEPLKIFGMIIWQMHLIAMVEAAGSRSEAEIMNISGLKPFTLTKTRSIARRMGRERIKNLLDRLVKLDRQMKTTPVNPDDALKNLLISL